MTEEEEARKRLYDMLLGEIVECVLIPVSARLEEDVLFLMQRSHDAFRDYIRTLCIGVRTGIDSILAANGIDELDTDFWTTAYVRTGEYLNGAIPHTCPYCLTIIVITKSNTDVEFMLSLGTRTDYPELEGNTNPRTVPVRRIDDRADPYAFTPTN